MQHESISIDSSLLQSLGHTETEGETSLKFDDYGSVHIQDRESDGKLIHDQLLYRREDGYYDWDLKSVQDEIDDHKKASRKYNMIFRVVLIVLIFLTLSTILIVERGF